jgi:hypothetical protein
MAGVSQVSDLMNWMQSFGFTPSTSPGEEEEEEDAAAWEKGEVVGEGGAGAAAAAEEEEEEEEEEVGKEVRVILLSFPLSMEGFLWFWLKDDPRGMNPTKGVIKLAHRVLNSSSTSLLTSGSAE